MPHSLLDDLRPGDPRHAILLAERDRAERFLNRVRLVVLVLLAVAAAIYAPSLTRVLNTANVVVLVPTLGWALIQYPLFYKRELLPSWLGVANPLVDTTAVTAIVWAYSLAESPGLAFKTPIFAAYFVIFAALPVASSPRKTMAVAALAVAEYSSLLFAAAASGRLQLILDPIQASAQNAVSPLDEGAKILLLACAGAVAAYASRWQERLTARYAEASTQSLQLKSRLELAQLSALKLQLQPHFLFNTLNAITALVHRDPGRAEQMVSGLSELLRVSLKSAGEQEVTLGRELETLHHYVEIQQVRFEDRLSVAIDVPEDVRKALVPNLILQPLVENSIKHGLAPRAASGEVIVEARRQQDRLELVVRDNGVGEGDPSHRREGVGLGNTRSRLQSLYGAAHEFSAGSPGEGFVVRIVLPFKLSEESRDGS